MSLWKQEAYSTARACAAGCLVYNGDYPCQVRGYHDLGVELGCGGCGPLNGCYCHKDRGSSATSYITACVSYKCAASVSDWEVDATAMVGLYDGYCATANVGQTKTTAAANPTNTTPGGGGGSGTGPGQTPDAGAASQTAPAGATPTGTAAPEKTGLSQSDIVALAASLGVGIPSIAIAGLTLWIQLRRRKRAGGAKEVAAGTPSPSPSQPHVVAADGGGQMGVAGPIYYPQGGYQQGGYQQGSY